MGQKMKLLREIIRKTLIQVLIKEAAGISSEHIGKLYQLYRYGDEGSMAQALSLADAYGLNHEDLIKEFIKYIGDENEIGQFAYETGYRHSEMYAKSGGAKNMIIPSHVFDSKLRQSRDYDSGAEEYTAEWYAQFTRD